MKNIFIIILAHILAVVPLVVSAKNYPLPTSCESKVVYGVLQDLLKENGILVDGCATIETQRPITFFTRSLVVYNKKPYCQQDRLNTSEKIDAITYHSYVNDLQSKITSFAVRGERKPKDGYSIECSIIAEVTQTSKSESFENKYLLNQIFIRILKNGGPDGMYYEYDINQAKLTSSKIAGTGVSEIRKGLKSDNDMGLMSNAELSAVGRPIKYEKNQ